MALGGQACAKTVRDGWFFTKSWKTNGRIKINKSNCFNKEGRLDINIISPKIYLRVSVLSSQDFFGDNSPEIGHHESLPILNILWPYRLCSLHRMAMTLSFLILLRRCWLYCKTHKTWTWIRSIQRSIIQVLNNVPTSSAIDDIVSKSSIISRHYRKLELDGRTKSRQVFTKIALLSPTSSKPVSSERQFFVNSDNV